MLVDPVQRHRNERATAGKQGDAMLCPRLPIAGSSPIFLAGNHTRQGDALQESLRSLSDDAGAAAQLER
jgi:hypothetical protein